MKVVGILIMAGMAFSAPPSLEGEVNDYGETDGFKLAARIQDAEDAGTADELKTRLWGGWYPQLGQFPYTAGTLTEMKSGKRTVCGATLISNTRLLTAGHCWVGTNYEGEAMTVVLGSTLLYSGGARIVARQVIVHEHYTMPIPHNHTDIAMIVIPTVTFTENIDSAVVPSAHSLNQNWETYSAVVTAYGSTSKTSDMNKNRSLIAVTLKIISDQDCAYAYFNTNNRRELPPSLICAAQDSGQGICAGDSGGPLTVEMNGQRMLIGIVRGSRHAPCEAGFPAWFTRVPYFISWIADRL